MKTPVRRRSRRPGRSAASRAASTFDLVSHSSRSSGRRIMTDRFSSPGRCMCRITGCSSAPRVIIAVACGAVPSDPFSVRRIPAPHSGCQPAKPMLNRTCLPVPGSVRRSTAEIRITVRKRVTRAAAYTPRPGGPALDSRLRGAPPVAPENHGLAGKPQTMPETSVAFSAAQWGRSFSYATCCGKRCGAPACRDSAAAFSTEPMKWARPRQPASSGALLPRVFRIEAMCAPPRSPQSHTQCRRACPRDSGRRP